MERFQVSGAHGYLGSHLASRLEAAGQEVIKGDRYGTVDPRADYLIWCASFGNLYGQDDKNEIHRANVIAFEPYTKADVKGLIYVSSSSVLLEDRTTYADCKLLGERLCLKANGIVVRPSSITGLGEQDVHLIPKLIDSCLNGTEMPFIGEPTHDYIDVEDVVSAISLLLQVPEARGKAFNVSSGRTTSNEEVLSLVETLTDKKANIKRVSSLRPYDTTNWKVDSSQMLELGWIPRVYLHQSIQRMINEQQMLASTSK